PSRPTRRYFSMSMSCAGGDLLASSAPGRRKSAHRGCSSAAARLSRAEREQERRSLTGPRLGPDAPTMPCDNPIHRRQPDPRPLKLLGRMQSLKRRKQLGRVLHGEPGAIVLDVKDGFLATRFLADHDRRGRLLRRELPRVAQEILEHHSEKPRV